MIFLWNARNEQHIEKHDVSKPEAEYIIRHASRPYPREMGDGKYKVWGQTQNGRLLQVIYVLRRVDEVGILELPPHIMALAGADEMFRYVIHARELSVTERQQLRRQRGKR